MDKLREAAVSTLPIIIIVAILCLFITPVPSGLMVSFVVGSVMVIVGMGLFTLGADCSMMIIGSRIGSALTKTRKLHRILLVSFVLGLAITVAEPDLQVLAETVPHIDNLVLIVTVGVGVGLFLMVGMLRIFFGVRLRWMLIGFYGLVFLLAVIADADFLSVAFDSGGVTTGPMTVPFILSFGVGVAHIRSDNKAAADSFGLVSLCSIGPILAVLILSLFYDSGGTHTGMLIHSWDTTVEVGMEYLGNIPHYIVETSVALLPILAIFVLFQLVKLRMSIRSFLRVCAGIVYTFVGLVLFLTGVNVGFSPLGYVLGQELTEGWRFLMVPLAMLLGYFIISAEPAVHVLEEQIEEVSSGAIPARAIKLSLSVAIALAMGLAMIKVFSGINIMWFLVPCYAIALGLSFFVPDIYTAIAFDSGGVASGPMTATFMLQFMMGACAASGGDIIKDAFGIVAMVAMMPLISIQLMGLVYGGRKRAEPTPLTGGDLDIIELWG